MLKSIDMVDGLKITEICLFSTVCDVNDTRNQGQSRYQVTYSERRELDSHTGIRIRNRSILNSKQTNCNSATTTYHGKRRQRGFKKKER